MEDLLIRLNSAVDFLQDSLPFNVEGLYFGINTQGYLCITGVSQSISLENITNKSALIELSEIKRQFSDLLGISKVFDLFVSNRKWQYNLDFDYGMGDIRICSELDDIVNWHFKTKG